MYNTLEYSNIAFFSVAAELKSFTVTCVLICASHVYLLIVELKLPHINTEGDKQ